MQKLLLAAAILLFATGANAQKFMTRTGKVTFFSSTALENIEAVNNDAASVINAGTGEVVMQVPIKSFRFEKQLMQEHFNENYMESDKYPKAEYKGKIMNLSDVNFAKDGVYNVTTAGKMTIHGVTRDITIPGTVTVKGSSATINSKFNVKPADYGIKIPAIVSTKVSRTIEVTVNSVLNKTAG